MNKLRLMKAVTVTGEDVFGRKAVLDFLPAGMNGWYWRAGLDTVRIDWRRAGCRACPGYLFLRHENWTLPIWEHIGSLRFFGLDGVIVSGTSWPPYHGRPLEVWQKLKLSCEPTDEAVSWISPRRFCDWHYPNGRTGCVQVTPPAKGEENTLFVEVIIDYPGLGATRVAFKFPEQVNELENIFSFHAQGWPRWRYYLCLFASELGWPHLAKISWPQGMSREQAIKAFAYHRVGDLLGGFSLASAVSLPSGQITSIHAGHRADLAILESGVFV